MSARNNIDGKAGAAMVMICAIWGLQQVAIKAAEPDISAVLQIAIRSGIAALAVYLLARFKGEKFLFDPRTLLAGFGVGLSFALEFFFVSEGLRYTSASHMAVFLYTAPLFLPSDCIFSSGTSVCRLYSGPVLPSLSAVWCLRFPLWARALGA